MTSQSSKRAALSQSILGLVKGAGEPGTPAPAGEPPAGPGPGPESAAGRGQGGESAAGRGIVGKALALHTEGLIDKVARLEAEREAEARGGVRLLSVDPALIDDPLPPDRDPRAFADDAFARLKESIREKGQDTPVIVRSAGAGTGRFELAAGRRRVTACRELGLAVLARVLTLSDEDMLALQYRENVEREDVSAYERGRWLARLTEERALSTTQLGRMFGLSQPSIVEYLKLARLPGDLVEHLEDPRELTLNDARRLHAALTASEALPTMVRALAGQGNGLGTKARVALALKAVAGRRSDSGGHEPLAQGRIITDGAGRKLVTITRSGNQWLYRWAPEVEAEAIAALAERIPELLETWRRQR